MLGYSYKTLFKIKYFLKILLSFTLVIITSCSDSTSTSPTTLNQAKWIHTTVEPLKGSHTTCGYMITFTNEAFQGQYLAELYLENADSSRYLAFPFSPAIGNCDYFVLYLYEGRIEFQYPDFYPLSKRNVHILVMYPN